MPSKKSNADGNLPSDFSEYSKKTIAIEEYSLENNEGIIREENNSKDNEGNSQEEYSLENNERISQEEYSLENNERISREENNCLPYNDNQNGYNFGIPMQGPDKRASGAERNIYGGVPYDAASERVGQNQNMDNYYNRTRIVEEEFNSEKRVYAPIEEKNAYAPAAENTHGMYASEKNAFNPSAIGKKTYNMPASFENKRGASYEKVGIFARFLNILAMLAALGVIAMGLLKILGENGIDIDSRVTLAGLEFMFSASVMLLLQIFVSVIWLLCFNKAARICTVVFLTFLITEFIFGSLFPTFVKSETFKALLLLFLNIGAVCALITVSFLEQHIKNTRGFTLFFGALFIAAQILMFIFGKNVIKLPEAVPAETAVSVAGIFATACYVIMFLCLNTLWRKRKLKDSKRI